MKDFVFHDAFNLLCGKLIDEGAYRQVFTCQLRPELVVKVESSDDRGFHNVLEWRFWDEHQYFDKVSKWLAPCRYMSPDGRVLLQERVEPLRDKELPPLLPAFLTDVKRENFGYYKGRVVCCDYGFTTPNPSIRMRKAEWWN